MNRLIIVGNGFDLAHGLPTRYSDFIIWYLKKVFDEASSKGTFSDELITITCEDPTSIYQPGFYTNSSEMIEYFRKNIGMNNLLKLKKDSIINNVFNNSNVPIRLKSPFSVNTNSDHDLLSKIISQIDKLRWVDIELEYYTNLKEVLNENSNNSEAIELKLKSINGSLNCISKELSKYLKTLNEPKLIYSIKDKIYSKIRKKEFLEHDARFNDILDNNEDSVESITILNFNYTSTLNQYNSDFLSSGHNSQIKQIINIHGQISDGFKDPIVFGFGDELDEDYKRMENSKIKGFFEHAKSFSYFNNDDYPKLVRFIDSGQYQVFIFGHSCGLSDRTLLNMIFEHDNCKSIKIYYHRVSDETTTYRETTEEISRHFKDKIKMRNRVVNFKLSEPLVD
jgi:hypothetical protein